MALFAYINYQSLLIAAFEPDHFSLFHLWQVIRMLNSIVSNYLSINWVAGWPSKCSRNGDKLRRRLILHHRWWIHFDVGCHENHTDEMHYKQSFRHLIPESPKRLTSLHAPLHTLNSQHTETRLIKAIWLFFISWHTLVNELCLMRPPLTRQRLDI